MTLSNSPSARDGLRRSFDGTDLVDRSLSHPSVSVDGVDMRQKRTGRSTASASESSLPSEHPRRNEGELNSVRFAQIARRLNQTASAAGLRTPAFRSPPRTPGLCRSITRRADGSATVSVALRGRPAVAVVADMIDGVMAANEPGSTRSAAVSDRLWAAAAPLLMVEVDSVGQPADQSVSQSGSAPRPRSEARPRPVAAAPATVEPARQSSVAAAESTPDLAVDRKAA